MKGSENGDKLGFFSTLRWEVTPMGYNSKLISWMNRLLQMRIRKGVAEKSRIGVVVRAMKIRNIRLQAYFNGGVWPIPYGGVVG